MSDYCRRRGHQSDGRSEESFSSSSDDERSCPKPKRKMITLAKCGPVRGFINSSLLRARRRLRCLDPRNWTEHGVALASILLFSALSYLYGMELLRLLLPESWLKNTEQLIREALAKYSADRLGWADYALESAGGSVLCSSTTYYSKSGALYSLFGVPLWYHSSTPRMVIQPDVQPGTCWAMDGNKGFVTIQLAMPVIITAISLEHIPKEVSPLGRLDSAPKEFVILGKETTVDSPEVPLGKFTYSINQDPIQTYDIKEPYCAANFLDKKCGPNTKPYSIVTLKILSNHGNPEYTCIYRFRVHGKPYFIQPNYD